VSDVLRPQHDLRPLSAEVQLEHDGAVACDGATRRGHDLLDLLRVETSGEQQPRGSVVCDLAAVELDFLGLHGG
jgi:hypothetical protein